MVLPGLLIPLVAVELIDDADDLGTPGRAPREDEAECIGLRGKVAKRLGGGGGKSEFW